jgi:hypothetical protein
VGVGQVSARLVLLVADSRGREIGRPLTLTPLPKVRQLKDVELD